MFMKRAVAGVLGGCVLAALLLAGYFVWRDLNRIAWTLNAENRIKEASSLIQVFREENGSYPSSLEKAIEQYVQAHASTDWVERVSQLTGCPDSYFEYSSQDDGFSLGVVRRKGILRSEWRVVKRFDLVDPLKSGR